MEKETKKWKDGAEKEHEKKRKKFKEIAAKCVNIQKAFTRASTSTESQTTVNPALLLKYQDQHQSVSYHDVPASDLVNQNCSDQKVKSILYILMNQNQTISAKIILKYVLPLLTQVLESQCRQSVNIYSALSDSKDYYAISAQVSEVQ